MAVDWIGFGYAALVTSGGFIGYAKAGTVLEVPSDPLPRGRSGCSLRQPPVSQLPRGRSQ